MKNGLRILAALVAVLTLAVWLATGAHTGWTKTQVTVMKVDPITELDYPEIQDQFVAGVDVLAGGLITAFVLFGCSFLFKSQPNKHGKENQP